MARPLTKRQVEILTFLRERIGQNGYAPTLQQIGAHFGLSALATVHRHLVNLETKGYITRRWNQARSIELREDVDGCCPYCKQPMPAARPA